MESIRMEYRFRPLRKALLLLLGMLLLIIATAPRCSAQNWAEWFKQKKTQKKYLLNQIAALQVYIGYARQGYELVGSGLETVRAVTGGEFGLHEGFIYGLKAVSPLVKADPRVAEILDLQLGMIRAFSGIQNLELSADQVLFVAEVAGNMMAECKADLEELLLVLTSGKLEMKEEERLARLGSIHARMQEKSAFSREFCGEASLVAFQRKMEVQAVDKLRRYYGIE